MGSGLGALAVNLKGSCLGTVLKVGGAAIATPEKATPGGGLKAKFEGTLGALNVNFGGGVIILGKFGCKDIEFD